MRAICVLSIPQYSMFPPLSFHCPEIVCELSKYEYSCFTVFSFIPVSCIDSLMAQIKSRPLEPLLLQEGVWNNSNFLINITAESITYYYFFYMRAYRGGLNCSKHYHSIHIYKQKINTSQKWRQWLLFQLLKMYCVLWADHIYLCSLFLLSSQRSFVNMGIGL